MITAAATRTAWTAVVTPSSRSRLLASSRSRRPAASAPAAKQAIATTEASAENPPVPASAKARKTTLPVMLATKT